MSLLTLLLGLFKPFFTLFKLVLSVDFFLGDIIHRYQDGHLLLVSFILRWGSVSLNKTPGIPDCPSPGLCGPCFQPPPVWESSDRNGEQRKNYCQETVVVVVVLMKFPIDLPLFRLGPIMRYKGRSRAIRAVFRSF